MPFAAATWQARRDERAAGVDPGQAKRARRVELDGGAARADAYTVRQVVEDHIDGPLQKRKKAGALAAESALDGDEGGRGVHTGAFRGGAMSEGQYNWTAETEIDRFVHEWNAKRPYRTIGSQGPADAHDELRSRLKKGVFSGENARAVEAFLQAFDAQQYRMSDAAKVDREERAALAVERSARAAEYSARRSGWALAISIAALFIAAWPYIKPAS